MSKFVIEPISKQVCFVVEKMTGKLVWRTSTHSWWPTAQAHKLLASLESMGSGFSVSSGQHNAGMSAEQPLAAGGAA